MKLGNVMLTHLLCLSSEYAKPARSILQTISFNITPISTATTIHCLHRYCFR